MVAPQTSRAKKPKRRLALITNRHAGRGTPRAGLGKVLGSILSVRYPHYDTATLAELDGAVRQIAIDRPDICAFAGGDGSVHQVLTRLIPEYQKRGQPLPTFLYFPTGTMRNIGKSIGLDRMPVQDFARHVAEKVAAQQRGQQAPFDVAHLNPLAVNDRYGFIYGSGLVVNFLREYERAPYHCEDASACRFRCAWSSPSREIGTCPRCGKKLIRAGLGPWRAAKVVGRAMLSRRRRHELMRPVHARVTFAPGFDPPVAPFMTHTALLAATVDQLGMGCRGMPQAMSVPGRCMFRSTQMSFGQLMLPTTLGALWTGLPVPGMFDAVVPSMSVEYQEPTVATIDGEMMPPSLIDRISVGPALSFVTG